MFASCPPFIPLTMQALFPLVTLSAEASSWPPFQFHVGDVMLESFIYSSQSFRVNDLANTHVYESGRIEMNK